MVRLSGSYKPEEVYKVSNGNPHKELPGSGVAYWEDDKRSEKAPDYKGFLVLEMDYKAGEKLKMAFWERKTARGTTLLSIKEDTWLKRKKAEENAPTEVQPSYRRNPPKRQDDDESDCPF
jgi:hypothetical protein